MHIVQACSVFYQFLLMEKCFLVDVAFRREVILCAEKIGNCAAGRLSFFLFFDCAHALGFVG
jgi:hypothetical protein